MVHPSNVFVISIYISQLNPKTDIYVSVMIQPETSIKNEDFLIRGCERKKNKLQNLNFPHRVRKEFKQTL